MFLKINRTSLVLVAGLAVAAVACQTTPGKQSPDEPGGLSGELTAPGALDQLMPWLLRSRSLSPGTLKRRLVSLERMVKATGEPASRLRLAMLLSLSKEEKTLARAAKIYGNLLTEFPPEEYSPGLLAWMRLEQGRISDLRRRLKKSNKVEGRLAQERKARKKLEEKIVALSNIEETIAKRESAEPQNDAGPPAEEQNDEE